MPERIFIGIVIFLAAVVALFATNLTGSSAMHTFAEEPSSSVASSNGSDSKDSAEERPVTILYTLHNEGYIEPCG